MRVHVRNVIKTIDTQQLHKVFIEWMGNVVEHLTGVVAVDGKQARRTKDGKKKPLHVVSAFSAECGLVLGQLACEEKSNEITAIPKLLEMLEIEVDRASSGASAIAFLDKNKVDLILTDDMMPEMSGTQMMEYLKSNKEGANYQTPIVVLTANAVVGAREEYINFGFDEYMTKPIDIDVLQKILMKYLK